jgi:hypothetical protein
MTDKFTKNTTDAGPLQAVTRTFTQAETRRRLERGNNS